MGINRMKDNEILQQLISGDTKAFTRFYNTHSIKLRNYLLQKIDSEDEREEIMQMTFVAFFEAIRDYEGRSSITTYLFSICRHKVIDYYRTKKSKTVVFSSVPHIDSLLSTLCEPEEAYHESITREKIKKTFSLLHPIYRDILLCKYDEGLGVSEIAKKFRLSFKSAEAKLFRARKAFVSIFSTHT
jgi:RNA polymerase sigma-70 factor, ECF subfamily